MTARLRRSCAALRDDRRGATLIEFAIVAPVLLLLLMGLWDLLYQTYAQSILDGAIQKAGRDSAIEGGSTNAASIDAKVLAMARKIGGGARFATAPVRKNYSTFSTMKPENLTDKNGNGKCDKGEQFTDINGNGNWDLDPGLNGQGGAEDVTKYTVSIAYPRVFPMATLLGWSRTMTITSTTILKNQPFDAQHVIASQLVTCK